MSVSAIHEAGHRVTGLDFSTSVHESAHAVIAAHYGFVITALSIEPAAGHMGVTERQLPDLEPEYVERARRQSSEQRRRVLDRAALMLATISLAGPTGERLLGALPECVIEECARTDYDRAQSMVAEISDADRRYTLYLARAEAKARGLVRSLWGEILELAVVLARRRRLDADEIRAIIERSTPETVEMGA